MPQSPQPPDPDRTSRVRQGFWIVGIGLGLYWVISGIYGLLTSGS
ncbi:MAG: hypothetical protein ACK5H2_08280 [Beutenbergiaceae bacterium]